MGALTTSTTGATSSITSTALFESGAVFWVAGAGLDFAAACGAGAGFFLEAGGDTGADLTATLGFCGADFTGALLTTLAAGLAAALTGLFATDLGVGFAAGAGLTGVFFVADDEVFTAPFATGLAAGFALVFTGGAGTVFLAAWEADFATAGLPFAAGLTGLAGGDFGLLTI